MATARLLAVGLVASLTQMTPLQAAPKSQNGVAAQRAMDECALQYCGYRSASVTQSKPMWVESCFRQKTGRTPAEMGVAMKATRCCPAAPCY